MEVTSSHHGHPPQREGCITRERGDAKRGASRHPRRPRHQFHGPTLVIVASIVVISIAWLLLIFTVDRARFVIAAPQAKTGFEVLLAVGQLFGALVLAIFPDSRLRWASLGLLVLGLGAFGFAYLNPIIDNRFAMDTMIYGSGFIRTSALVLIALSVWPQTPPELTRRRALTVLAAIVTLGILLAAFAEMLPPLIEVTSIEAVTNGTGRTLPGLTGLHWTLAPIPLALSVMVTSGALRHFPGSALGGWLVAALALFSGAQLHSVFWPSLYSSVLTSASVLRLAFTLVLVTGGILELRALLAQRDALLAEEQERLRRLEELGRMKDDFTAIVAHELSSPVGAVGALADILAIPDLSAEQRGAMTDALQREVRMLHTLVSDVRAVSAIERDDFTINPRPVHIDDLLAEVAAFASSLESCRIETEIEDIPGLVHADPERIGQVLRNLLSNACKHTPPGTRVVLRARHQDGAVRVEVADDGPGIAPEDHERIFDKYARGHDREQRRIRGRGLGLYISRRIVQLHGSDLRVHSEPGHGACFAFDLEVAS